MAKAETTTRAPRGAKPVSQAFFAALETIPEATRSAVAKAAQTMIRDELKLRGEKVKAATAKAKAKTSALLKAAAPKPMVKTVAAKAKVAPTVDATPVKKSAAKAKPAPVVEAAPVKSRGRKAVSVPAAS
jgi:hypothetical protein